MVWIMVTEEYMMGGVGQERRVAAGRPPALAPVGPHGRGPGGQGGGREGGLGAGGQEGHSSGRWYLHACCLQGPGGLSPREYTAGATTLVPGLTV